jgi:hypothetical protein
VDAAYDLIMSSRDQETTIARELARTESRIAELNRDLDGYAHDLRDEEIGSRSRRSITNQMRLIEEQLDALEAQSREYVARREAFASADRIKAAQRERIRVVAEEFRRSGELTDPQYRKALEGLPLRFFYTPGKLRMEWMHEGSPVLGSSAIDATSRGG